VARVASAAGSEAPGNRAKCRLDLSVRGLERSVGDDTRISSFVEDANKFLAERLDLLLLLGTLHDRHPYCGLHSPVLFNGSRWRLGHGGALSD
jgi:hypothetical protein